MLLLRVLFLLQTSLAGPPCYSTLPELEAALSSGRPGDVLVICDGDYSAWDLLVAGEGLTLRADTPGRVSLHLGSRLTVQGSQNLVTGIKFHGGGSSTPITIAGERNTVRDCVVEHHQAVHWVLLTGVDNTVSHCRFSNKTAKEGISIIITYYNICTIYTTSIFNTGTFEFWTLSNNKKTVF